jgi:hypothetical protein
MAALTAQDAPIGGLADVVFTAADTLGDDAVTGNAVALLIRNDDAAAKTVTIDTPGTVRGLDIENPALVVSAGELGVFPLVRQVFGASAAITYSAVTNLFVAVVKLAR